MIGTSAQGQQELLHTLGRRGGDHRRDHQGEQGSGGDGPIHNGGDPGYVTTGGGPIVHLAARRQQGAEGQDEQAQVQRHQRFEAPEGTFASPSSRHRRPGTSGWAGPLPGLDPQAGAPQRLAVACQNASYGALLELGDPGPGRLTAHHLQADPGLKFQALVALCLDAWLGRLDGTEGRLDLLDERRRGLRQLPPIAGQRPTLLEGVETVERLLEPGDAGGYQVEPGRQLDLPRPQQVVLGLERFERRVLTE